MPIAPSPRQRVKDGVPSTPTGPKAALLKGGRPHSQPSPEQGRETMADGHHGASSPRGPMQGDDADGRICVLQHSTLAPLPKELGRKPLGLELGRRAKALSIPSTWSYLSLLHSTQSTTPTHWSPRCFSHPEGEIAWPALFSVSLCS